LAGAYSRRINIPHRLVYQILTTIKTACLQIPTLDNGCMEIVFSVTQEEDSGFVAECLSQDIITQGDNWDELRTNVREVVAAYFFDGTKPSQIRLHPSYTRLRHS